MAKFLVTKGISYYLEELVKNAKERLILVSPYIKMDKKLKELIEEQNRLKLDIRIIYGKSDLQPDEDAWFKSIQSVRLSFCQDLHAKCYLSENTAIITSMNLYEFSEINNHEMGIYVAKADDPDLYQAIYAESQRLIRISDEVERNVSKVSPVQGEKRIAKASQENSENVKQKVTQGFCIRCQAKIRLNSEKPYCKGCYSSWAKFQNPSHEEKYCHSCGNTTKTCLEKPLCYSCYEGALPY